MAAAQERVAQLAAQIREAVAGRSLPPTVEAPMVLRGADFLTAATVMAELGDLSRFDSPRPLMAFLGLLPSEQWSEMRWHNLYRRLQSGACGVLSLRRADTP